MKLLGLDLLAFGPFTDVSLDLSSGDEGLHLIFGPNEAGKSSALRAVRQLFAGIPHLSNDDFVHKGPKLRIGAKLRGPRGDVLEFRRRKGRKDTLLDLDDAPLDDACLPSFLGGLDPAEFAAKFAIDHAELVAGGKAVIAGGGDIGRLLFAAGAGLVGLADIQKRLEEECEALFKRGGSKPRINATWTELETARKARNDAALRGSEWLEHDEALRRAREAKQQVDAALERARRTALRLDRFAKALEPIARRKQLQDELAPLADAVRLSSDFAFKRREAASLLQPAQAGEADARRDLAELELSLKALQVPEQLLEQAEAIELLHLRLGSHQEATRERSRLDAECAQLEAEAESIRRDVALKPASPEIAPLTTAERVEIQDLGNDRQVVFKARDDARQALEKHAARSAKTARQLEALGPLRDPAPLRRAVTQAQRQGELEDAIRVDCDVLERDERRAADELATLGLWSGALEDLERLAVPSAETIERFQAEVESAVRALDDVRTRIEALESQNREIDAQVEQLRLEREVPTEADLEEARQLRDERWALLKQDWASGPAGAPASAFEQNLTEADELADRLRREADRVATQAKLLADRSRCQNALAQEARKRAEADEALHRVQEAWTTLWTPLHITPLSPREMLAWTRRQGELATLARSIREKRLAISQREARTTELCRALVEALESIGEPSQVSEPSLAAFIERSQERIETLGEEARSRKRLETDLAALEAERAGLDERAAAAERALDQWQTRWCDAMRRLGLPEDASPSQANAVAGRVIDLFDRLDKAQAHRRRLETIERDATRFAADVWALAARVAPDRAEAPPEQLAAELNARLTHARAAAQRKQSLLERREQTEQTLRAHRASVLEMKARLATLCTEARCEHEDELPAIEERSTHRQKLEAELADVNRELRRLAGTEPLDAFLREAEDRDPDALALEIERLEAEIAQRERERENHDQTIGREEMYLKLTGESPGAADADQEAENLRSRIRADVEDYARLRLASAILREGIERYRQKRQGPVLARAGTLFATLTLGSFEGLRVDYGDRDEPVLKGVRPGGESVGVEGMSLGTADQLYLALRLASLETFLEKGEPVPFLIDDILIHFDDDRAAAALEILGALSRRTQILLFTHHQRLVELAESRLDPSLLITHTLPARTAAVAGLS